MGQFRGYELRHFPSPSQWRSLWIQLTAERLFYQEGATSANEMMHGRFYKATDMKNNGWGLQLIKQLLKLPHQVRNCILYR